MLEEITSNIGQLIRGPVDANPGDSTFSENLKAWRQVETKVAALRKVPTPESLDDIAETVLLIKTNIGRFSEYTSWCHKSLERMLQEIEVAKSLGH